MIFSDEDSKDALAKRQYQQSINWAVINSANTLIWLVILLNSSPHGFWGFLNFKDLYLTPGLWESSGFSFWFSFLFETVFIVLPFRTPLLFLVNLTLTICYFLLARKQKKQFDKK